MTKAGKLEREFNIFKQEVEARLAALEAKKTVTTTKTKTPVVEAEPDKSIVIEAKDDIVAKDAE